MHIRVYTRTSAHTHTGGNISDDEIVARVHHDNKDKGLKDQQEQGSSEQCVWPGRQRKSPVLITASTRTKPAASMMEKNHKRPLPVGLPLLAMADAQGAFVL